MLLLNRHKRRPSPCLAEWSPVLSTRPTAGGAAAKSFYSTTERAGIVDASESVAAALIALAANMLTEKRAGTKSC